MLYFVLGFLFGFGFLLTVCLATKVKYDLLQDQHRAILKDNLLLNKFLQTSFEKATKNLSQEDIYHHLITVGLSLSRATSARFFKYDDTTKMLSPGTYIGLFPLLKTLIPRNLPLAQINEYIHRGESFFLNEYYIEMCAIHKKALLFHKEDLNLIVKNFDSRFKIHSLFLCPVVFQRKFFGLVAFENLSISVNLQTKICKILQVLCQQTGMVLNILNEITQSLETRSLQQDLTLAHHIQNYLLPLNTNLSPLSCEIYYKTSRGIGGDFYHLLKLDDHRFIFVIGDVSGKGIGSALIMANCLPLLKQSSIINNSPVNALIKINEQLSGTLPNNIFVTMAYTLIDTQAKTLELARAGHEYPFLLGKAGAKKLTSAGSPLGILPPDLFNKKIESLRYPFSETDRLFLFTDGFIEAKNTKGEEYSATRLMENAALCKDKTLEETKTYLLKTLREFTEKKDLKDDTTLLVIGFKNLK